MILPVNADLTSFGWYQSDPGVYIDRDGFPVCNIVATQDFNGDWSITVILDGIAVCYVSRTYGDQHVPVGFLLPGQDTFHGWQQCAHFAAHVGELAWEREEDGVWYEFADYCEEDKIQDIWNSPLVVDDGHAICAFADVMEEELKRIEEWSDEYIDLPKQGGR